MANKFIIDQRRLREITRVLLKHKIQSGLNPEKVRKIAEDLGPTFVKIGQILSMRDDIIPLAYCEELKKLRLNVAYMPFNVVKEQVEKATGKSLNELFKSVEEFNNVFTAIFLDIPTGCCQTLSVKNVSEIPVNVQNANLIVERVA